MPIAAKRPKSKRGYAGQSACEMDAGRRVRLMDTALELFTRQGYRNTPIEQLCAESRVTSRYFYELFESREALLRALFDDIIRSSQAAIIAELALHQSPLDQILSAVKAFIAAYVEDSRRARLCIIEAVGVSSAMERRRRAVIHDFAGLLEGYANRLTQEGKLVERDHHLFCVALVGGINEVLADWLSIERGRPSIQTLTEEIDIFLRVAFEGGIRIAEAEPHNTVNRKKR